MAHSISGALNHQPMAKPSLTSLSLVGSTRPAMKDWLSGLSLMNVGETARQLYTTLKELNELDIDDVLRFELIELMRPSLKTISQSLAKYYVPKTICLDEREEKLVELNQLIQVNTFIIYRSIAIRLSAKIKNGGFGVFGLHKKKEAVHTVASSVHRSMAELTALLYECQRLYLPLIDGLWRNLYELYILADMMGVRDTPIRDRSQTHDIRLNIDQVYLRALLMGSANVNKLRQSEIQGIYQFSELWAMLMEIHNARNDDILLFVNQTTEFVPQYLLKESDVSTQTVFVSVKTLLDHIAQATNARYANEYLEDERVFLSGTTRKNLLEAFTSPYARTTDRVPFSGTIDLSFGLVGAHYHLSGKRIFDANHVESNLEVIEKDVVLPSGDVVSITVPVENSVNDKRPAVPDEVLQEYTVEAMNVSSGGFGLRWSGAAPNTLRTGELIALRPSGSEVWGVGLIRWVRQQFSAGIEFGVENIAQVAVSCAIRAFHNAMNGAPFLRALLIQDTTDPSRPVSLITPALVFKSGQRVLLRIGDAEYKAQLVNERMSTQSFSLFECVIAEQSIAVAETEEADFY